MREHSPVLGAQMSLEVTGIIEADGTIRDRAAEIKLYSSVLI